MADVQDKVVKLGQLGSAMTSFATKADARFVKKDGFETSVKSIAAQELAAQLIPENAKESLDTLSEIAAWIQAHPDDASALNAAVQALRTKLTLGVDPNDAEGAEYATVKAYVEAYVAAQISGIDTSNLVEKVEGKGLSTNDFTNEYKTKLDSIEFATDAEIDAVIAGIWSETQPTTPTDTPENA